jgi:hypothetical protein
MTSVKWLRSITAVREPFAGYQQAQAYRMRRSEDEEGEPVSLIAPRALMIPPGIPDFLTRSRLVDRGPVRIEGRAWSGRGDIAGVEFSADGGGSWAEAELGESAGRHAWRGWSYLWEPAAAGAHELCCRARDAAGNGQPLHAAWNVGGYANNAVQRVAVAVR